MMRGGVGWLVGLLLAGAGATSLLPAGTAGPTTCSFDWVQNDARTGGDAGNERALAADLGEGRYTGFLDVSRAVSDGDVVDWYEVRLPGAGEVAMAEADVNYPRGVHGMGVYLDVQAWAPGAAQATHLGHSTQFGGQNVTFVNAVPGLWHFRVAAAGIAPESVPCGSLPLLPATLPSPLAPPVYALYFGCDPHCD